jgi:hypothetical protein
MKGWVYIITTKSMPHLVKVGFSTKDPELRAAELNNTGNPYPYEVVYDVLVNEPRDVEQIAHGLLKNKGVHENKEWFNCSIDIAVEAIKQASAGGIILENAQFTSSISKLVDSKFIFQDGIATDTETGLMWLRFSHGQRWENGTVVGKAQKLNWDDAMKYPDTFNKQGYGGYNDWRVPNIDELKTLIDKVKGKYGNYVDVDAFPKNEKYFWSASYHTHVSVSVWYVGFDLGNSNCSGKYGSSDVRLVR